MLEDGAEKTALIERVSVIAVNLVNGSSFYEMMIVEKYVDLAEQYQSVSLINKAQSLVNGLKEFVAKTTLQNKINNL